MLQSFEAVYDQGRLHWLKDAPEKSNVKVIVTVIEELATPPGPAPRRYREPPPELASKMRILCDEKTLMEPAAPEEDWDALR